MTTVAEAFRGLDEERDALSSLAEAQRAASDFLGHYRRYAKVAAKRKAAGPRQTQARYEQLGRDLTTAEEAFTIAQQELDAAQRDLADWRSSAPNWRRAATRLRPIPRCGTRNGSRSCARTPAAGRRRRATATLTGTGRPATSGGTGQYGPGHAPAGTGRDKLTQALHDAGDASARARCAGQHQAAVAALGNPNQEAMGRDASGWPGSPTASTARPRPT